MSDYDRNHAHTDSGGRGGVVQGRDKSLKNQTILNGNELLPLDEVFLDAEKFIKSDTYSLNIENIRELPYSFPMSISELRLVDFLKTEYNVSATAAISLARQFHIRIVSEAPVISKNPDNLILPEKAPELYSERDDRRETPLKFYDRVWRKYADAGVLYLDYMNQLDPKLMPAVRVYCAKRGLNAKEHLPPSSYDRTKELAAHGDISAILRVRESDRQKRRRIHHTPACD